MTLGVPRPRSGVLEWFRVIEDAISDYRWNIPLDLQAVFSKSSHLRLEPSTATVGRELAVSKLTAGVRCSPEGSEPVVRALAAQQLGSECDAPALCIALRDRRFAQDSKRAVDRPLGPHGEPKSIMPCTRRCPPGQTGKRGQNQPVSG